MFVFALAGCFSDPPGIGEGGTQDGTGDSTSATDTPPTTGLDASTSTGGGDGTAGTDEASSDATGCEDGAPGCAEPGQTLWTVVLGNEANDGAYSIAIDGDDVVVAGEQGEGGSSSPWIARLHGDGTVAWSLPGSGGEGDNALRGVAAVGDGRVIAVGARQAGPANVNAHLDARALDGASVFDEIYQFADSNFLLSLALDDAGGFHAVGYVTYGMPMGTPEPVVVHYTGGPGDAWSFASSTLDAGLLAGIEGRLFGIDVAPTGDLVVVGSVITGASSDAALLVLSPEGGLLAGPVLIGSDHEDGFVDVAVDDDGSGVAVGRQGTGPTSAQGLIVHFTVAGEIDLGVQTTWGEAAFTSINGLARDGDTLFLAAGTSDDPGLVAASFDSVIVRWDGAAEAPTWTVPYEADSTRRDYAADVAIADADTIVVCGVTTPEGTDTGDAWIRKLAR